MTRTVAVKRGTYYYAQPRVFPAFMFVRGSTVALWEASRLGWLSDIVIVMQRLGVTEPQDWLTTLSTVQGVDC